MTDTIAAIATGYARTAIGILRISGPEARQVLAKVFTPFAGKTPLLERPAQSLIYGQLHDTDGAVLDNCLATFSVAPASYTGEDTAELQCHGSPTMLAAGLEALFAAGARQAKAGEFTRRAFLNGKMDLTQAEAVIDHLNRALAGCHCARRFGADDVLCRDWNALTTADFARVDRCGWRQTSYVKLHFDEHEAFSSLCFLEQHLTLQQLQAAADHLFADAACGHVLRVKGFAPDPQGTTGWLELNATAAGRTLEPIPQGQDVLIVIGEGLDRARIETQLHR